MEWSKGEEPPSWPYVPAVTTGSGAAQQLNVLPKKQDAMDLALGTETSSKPSTPEPTPADINPMLLASVSHGDWKELTFYLKREDAGRPHSMMTTRELIIDSERTGTITNDDVEEGTDQPGLPVAAPLLQGVTPLGDTALHVVASHGDGTQFLKCADMIYERAKHLLFALNKRGDTPLHCAARAGKSKMVSHLIDLAASEDEEGTDRRKHELLRKENKRQETALHCAVLIGDEGMVNILMDADPELANYPEDHGISALYLAILLEKYSIAGTLHAKSNGNLSYSGPNGQNALHIAILRNEEMTKKILEWNKSLTAQRDGDGSTPLHFASSLNLILTTERDEEGSVLLHFTSSLDLQAFKIDPICTEVFKANPAAMYLADNNGLFPIHVAASVGAINTIEVFLAKFPSSARLCDAKGRTFLHVAVEKEMLHIVMFVCGTQSLAWILNMQDNDGNTALHLVAKAGKLRMLCALLGNREVYLNLTNKDGETPLNLCRSKLPRGLGYWTNSEFIIWHVMSSVGAAHGALRWDKTQEKYRGHSKLEDEESKKMKDATQTFLVGSALIATVTFGANFALPGGYRADDHTNGGTPTFAGRYTFDAFMMANTLAFICSSIATIGFLFSGTSFVNLATRKFNLAISVIFMANSVTSMSAAFALGVYLILAPVARNTAVAICVLIPLVGLFPSMEHFSKLLFVAGPLRTRMGFFLGMQMVLSQAILLVFIALWPFIVIFGWASFARIHHKH